MVSAHNTNSYSAVGSGKMLTSEEMPGPLCGSRKSTKVGCMVMGILCYGLLFEVAILLVVGGASALWISNDDIADPLDWMGVVMVLVGVLLLAILAVAWYYQRIRDAFKGKKKTVDETSACTFHSLTATSYVCRSTDLPTAGDERTCRSPHSSAGLEHQELGSPNDHVGQYQLLHLSRQDQILYSGRHVEPPSGNQMSNSSRHVASSSPVEALGPCPTHESSPQRGLSAGTPPLHSSSSLQMPHPTAPQYSPASPSESPRTFLPNSQAYQSHFTVQNVYSGDVDIDFDNELPPPYTP